MNVLGILEVHVIFILLAFSEMGYSSVLHAVYLFKHYKQYAYEWWEMLNSM